MTLLENLQIVHQSFHDEMGKWLILAAMIVIAACMIAFIVRQASRAFPKERGKMPVALLLALVCGLTIYGGSKQDTGITGRVSYPYSDIEKLYLTDNGSQCGTNQVYISFRKNVIVPNTAPLVGYARPVGDTDDTHWVQFLDTTFKDFENPSWVAYEGAQTNNFQIFTTWEPEVVAHTNGVAIIDWINVDKTPEKTVSVPLRTAIIYGEKEFKVQNTVNATGMKVMSFSATVKEEDNE